MDADPIFVGEGDVEAARELVASTAQGELFLYPGDQHSFLDLTLPSYDVDAAALVTVVNMVIAPQGEVRVDVRGRD